MLAELFEREYEDPNQLTFLCQFDGCINIAKYEDIKIPPRTEQHPFKPPVHFLICVQGRYCLEHSKLFSEYVYQIQAYKPNKIV